tara:strand:+ start:130 stop:444 length:315 start_codon:yes stop_codon:yes gene_type:complete
MEKKICSTGDWGKYEDLSPTKLTTKLITKKFSNSKIINKNECLICYNKVGKNTSFVSCKLCSNVFHYKCYKEFTEKNNFYAMKCCHCGTKTLKFNIKHWWNFCW